MVNICRLCAALRKNEQLVTIEDTNHEICHKLLKCCQVEIRIDDLLPKCVCMSCIEALQQAFAFYTKVHESQESLSVFYPMSIVKNEEVEENVVSIEQSVTAVLKERTLQLTDDKNTPMVVKVETHDTIKQLQLISLFLEKTRKENIGDGEMLTAEGERSHNESQESLTVFCSSSIAKSDLPDHAVSVEKSLPAIFRKQIKATKTEKDETIEKLQFISEIEEGERNHDGVVDNHNETSAKSKENSSVILKGLLKLKNSISLSNNKHDSEMQELSEEMIDENKTESVQCSDVALDETWSSYAWSCSICKSKESCFWDLALHCQFQHGISHSDMELKCADCKKAGLPYYTFVNHVRFRHRSALTLCCDVCDMRCDDFEALAVHRRTEHSNERVYPSVLLCCECGRAFCTKKALRLHKRDHNNKQRFECNQCGAQHTSANTLKHHQEVHTGAFDDLNETWSSYAWSCTICESKESCFSDLVLHCQLQHGISHSDMELKCADCKKAGLPYNTFVNHVRFRHRSALTLCCDVCDMRCDDFEALAVHRRTEHSNERVYPSVLLCCECGRAFCTKDALRLHKRDHNNKQRFECNQCGAQYTSANTLKHHQEVHTGAFGDLNETWSSYAWSCTICESKESCFSDLVLHCQLQHGILHADMKFKCADCKKAGLPYYTFVNHVRFRHRSALTLCCDICDVRCDDFEALAVHRRTEHSNERVYPSVLLCCECGRAFFTKNALRLHKRDHTNKQRFECNQCGALYKSAYTLKHHQMVHSDIVGVKDYNCEYCGKSFRQKVNLKTHMYTHSDDTPYECSICKKSFKTSVYLMNHKKRHLNIRLFKCDHCEKSFSTKDAKLCHERTHTGDMPYKCEYCMRPFRYRGPYMDHLNRHTGNKPYSCLTCDIHFTNWSKFHRHMKRRHADDAAQTKKRTPRSLKHSAIQTDIKLFNCDHCEKSFHTKDAKLSHERTHTGEMPFVCEHCPRSFRYRRNYMNHLYEHNADKSYSCKICGLQFTNFSTYITHMKTHHAEEKAQTEKRKPQSNKKPEENVFECKDEVANAVHSPAATSGVLVEECCNALDVVLDDDHLVVKEESVIQDQHINS